MNHTRMFEAQQPAPTMFQRGNLRILRRKAVVMVAAAAVTLLAGCAAPNTADNRKLRPLEERRAQAIIEKAIIANGEKPGAGRQFKLEGGAVLTEELTVAGGPYGIAYLTETEVAQLKGALPARHIELMRPNNEAITFLIYQSRYTFDVSSEHSTTALMAEKKLARDVSDFVVHVVKQKAHQ